MLVNTPYNQRFVDELKEAVPYTHRKWDRANKIWDVAEEYAEVAQALISKYFGTKEVEIVTAKIWGGNSHKQTYRGGVTIDGSDLITPWGALSAKCDAFEIVESVGGYTKGDGRHAHDVEYTITVKCRKGAEWEAYGRGGHTGDYQIISRQDA